MLNIYTGNLHLFIFTKSSYKYGKKVWYRYSKKVVISNCGPKITMQNMIKCSLNSARGAVKTRQKMKRTFGH